MASMRIVQTVIGRCHCTVLAHSVIRTLHPFLKPTVTTNRVNRYLSVWTTARLSSSVANTQPSLTLECSTDGQPSPTLECSTDGQSSPTLECSTDGQPSPTLECSTDGKKLKVSWPDGEHSSYHSLWLRHNCTCPMCWDTTTDQRIVRYPDLVGGPTIHTTELCGSPDGSRKLSISWSYSNGSQHRGEIDLKWLRENSYSPTSLRERQQRSLPPVTRTLPQASYSDVLKGEEGVWKWLRYLNEYGVCLLTDVPTERGHIEKVVESAGLFPAESLYGLIMDVFSMEKPTNLAHTTAALPFHMDNCWYESPPGLQFLHCIRNDACVEGGESVLLDAFAVVEEMRKKHPQHFATLTRVPTTFQRIHSKRDSPASYRYQRSHILLDKCSNVTAIFWTPANEGPLFIPEEDIESYYEAYICLERMFTESDRKLTHLLKPGEAMTFNNRRFLHSRNAFKLNGGIRHLQGIYVNTDDFKSQVQVLASKFSPNYEVKTVFNQDSIYN